LISTARAEHNKTCETCLSKIRKTKPVLTVPSDFNPLKRIDTDFVDDNGATTTPDTSDNLVGEDRQFGGNLLYKDLIPRTTCFNSVRTCVSRSSWGKLRKQV